MVTIKEINERLKVLGEQDSAISEERDKLNETLIELVMNDKDIINEAPWKVNSSSPLMLDSTRDKHTKLYDILATDYHSHKFSKVCDIYFSDGDISLSFNNDDDYNEFILNNDVQRDFSHIKQYIKMMENEIDRTNKNIEAQKEFLAKLER
jgi:hypothetical protein